MLKQHQEWLGMAQPEGLVVTAHALHEAQASVLWPVTELQETLRRISPDPHFPLDLRRFLREVLGWEDDFVVESEHLPDTLSVRLESGEVIAPRLALRGTDGEYAILVGQTSQPGANLDSADADRTRGGTEAQRFERLLRDSGVGVGLLVNGLEFRLVCAPRGETAGWISFQREHLLSPDGRLLLAAFHMLLNQARLIALAPAQRLSGLLRASREFQSGVSEQLGKQVVSALRELLAGMQAADRLVGGAVLREWMEHDPRQVYSGLVTVLMRMVFILYAEERRLLPVDHALYGEGYSLTKLYSQLLEDRDRFGTDGLASRHGAWARVLTLFRILFLGLKAGSGPGALVIPPREGSFFDPDRYPFLEGRGRAGSFQPGARLDSIPKVADSVVFRMLEDLLVLNGERLQYKGLDVEQIGSVYEGLMGFDVETARHASRCLGKHHVVADLEELLAVEGSKRASGLEKGFGVKMTGKAAERLKTATTVDELESALAGRISEEYPGRIPPGTLFLQPGEERRRSGSHYTPRKLTQPIVERTLRPALESLGPEPTPEQLLSLRICDPAMGSGAFLVETCRQLADHLVAAWRRTNTTPTVPDDEDLATHARRLVACRCLYGVDRNPLAADLARLSLWLVTFAKNHPFTFVDHSLRHGDALVGLTNRQIEAFSWDPDRPAVKATFHAEIVKRLGKVAAHRAAIHAAGDPPDLKELRRHWDEAESELRAMRLTGDLVVAAWFAKDSERGRRTTLETLGARTSLWIGIGGDADELREPVRELREEGKPLPPLHWELEFPEVFGEHGGFDCIVGNPPFQGKNGIIGGNRPGYLDWLQSLHEGSHGNADLVAHFFRRAFGLLRPGGTFGLIATNTISQGDTRESGLAWIVTKGGGTIFAAIKRYKWPVRTAAVVVSVVHVRKGPHAAFELSGRPVDRITTFLVARGPNESPRRLVENIGLSFQGSIVLGMGFTFDDKNLARGSSPLAKMHELVAKDPRNRERIFPYIGGEELNDDPEQKHRRYVINFGELSEEEARNWPDLMAIVEERVKPGRDALTGSGRDARIRRERWWLWGRFTPALFQGLRATSRCLAIARVGNDCSLAFLPSGVVPSEQLVVFPVESASFFGIQQSRIHEVWARCFGSSMKDDLRYSPSDCFETFPLPPDWRTNAALEDIGRRYHEFRARLMIDTKKGMTKTYNDFHDEGCDSAGIAELRRLHAEMDAAVWRAYGWEGEPPRCEFLPDWPPPPPDSDEKQPPYRLRWPDDERDDVLARLLDLNARRPGTDERAAADEEGGDDEGEAPAAKNSANPRTKRATGELF